MANKKSIQVKGIKNLEKVEMAKAQAGATICIDVEDPETVIIICTTSFAETNVYTNRTQEEPIIIIGNHYHIVNIYKTQEI